MCYWRRRREGCSVGVNEGAVRRAPRRAAGELIKAPRGSPGPECESGMEGALMLPPTTVLHSLSPSSITLILFILLRFPSFPSNLPYHSLGLPLHFFYPAACIPLPASTASPSSLPGSLPLPFGLRSVHSTFLPSSLLRPQPSTQSSAFPCLVLPQPSPGRLYPHACRPFLPVPHPLPPTPCFAAPPSRHTAALSRLSSL